MDGPLEPAQEGIHFDVIQHPLLFAKLKAYGVDVESCALLKDYLSDRSQRVKVGSAFSNWERVKQGIPRGSVLEPTLFNIFINDLFTHVTQTKLNASADDHQIHHSSVDPPVLDTYICNDVEKANQWYSQNGMMVNVKKQQAFIIDQTEHKFSFPVKCALDIFGMTIDNRLNFDRHRSQIYCL